MHFYNHHIGDFRAGCFNMTRMERALYREMLDIYYDTEAALPDSIDMVCKLLGIRDEAERKMVGEILLLKFEQVEGRGYVHERCEREIAEYHAKADIARANGKLGGRPKKTQNKPSGNPLETGSEPSGNPEITGSQANHKPVTSNHKPKEEQSAARGTRLPDDWRPSPEDQAYCKKERPDLLLSAVAQNFYDYWIAQPGAKGRKADWSATWRGWVRKESPGIRQAAPAAIPRREQVL